MPAVKAKARMPNRPERPKELVNKLLHIRSLLPHSPPATRNSIKQKECGKQQQSARRFWYRSTSEPAARIRSSSTKHAARSVAEVAAPQLVVARRTVSLPPVNIIARVDNAVLVEVGGVVRDREYHGGCRLADVP